MNSCCLRLPIFLSRISQTENQAYRLYVAPSCYPFPTYQVHTVVQLCTKILARYLHPFSHPGSALGKTTLHGTGKLYRIYSCCFVQPPLLSQVSSGISTHYRIHACCILDVRLYTLYHDFFILQHFGVVRTGRMLFIV